MDLLNLLSFIKYKMKLLLIKSVIPFNKKKPIKFIIKSVIFLNKKNPFKFIEINEIVTVDRKYLKLVSEAFEFE